MPVPLINTGVPRGTSSLRSAATTPAVSIV